MSDVDVLIVLERTSYPPEGVELEDEDDVTRYMVDEWSVVSVHDAGTHRGDNEEAEAVRYEIDMIGVGDALFGGMRSNVPKEITMSAEKVLISGKMRWVVCGTGYYDGGPEYSSEFDIESVRVLKEYPGS